ncbi:MAG TPA: hypothetical protein ENJ35_00440 [Gammaproteobacteria bacterium]|nr:hypothetical protein [Gammaproteobacteria bacterium]
MTTKNVLMLTLLLLMLVTRYHHFGSALHLPDASWAIFFAGGFYFRQVNWLTVFLGWAGLIDYFAITQGGTSAYCISAAYPFLIPSYGALWLGGRWLRKFDGSKPVTLVYLLLSAVLATTLCFIISNGAFYLFSGRFGELSLADYGERFFRFYPMFLTTTMGYIALFSVIHIMIHQLQNHLQTVKS